MSCFTIGNLNFEINLPKSAMKKPKLSVKLPELDQNNIKKAREIVKKWSEKRQRNNLWSW